MTIKGVLKRNDEGKVIDAWEVSTPYDLSEGEEWCDRKIVRDFELKKTAEKMIVKGQPTSTHSTHLHPTQPTYTQDYLLTLLSRGRPKISQLKCGIHDDKYYFGTVIPDIGTFMPLNAVITSDKRLFADMTKGQKELQIRHHFRLHYRSDFEFEALDSHWSEASQEKFMTSKEYSSLSDLFQRIKDLNKKYMYYPDDAAHSYVALDIISTYFLPCFEAKGRTFLEAEKGSGKTRQCTIYKLLSFNSVMSADISKSSFYRIMEGTCGTLIIDDFDSIGDEQKKDILQHYKTGYKNTSKSVRTGEGRNRKQETYRNYGHVVMNNTSGLDEISADRSVYLPIIKTEGPITNKAINEQDEIWGQIRDDLFCSAMYFWKDVKDTYQLLKTDNLSGRSFEVGRAILTIAEIIGGNLREEMERWLSERLNDNTYFDPETDWTYLAFKEFFDKSEGDQFRIKAVAENICSAAEGLNSTDKDWGKKVHGICSFLGKSVFRTRPGIFKVVPHHGTNVVRLISREKFDAYVKVKGWTWVDQGGGGLPVAHTDLEVEND